MQLERKRTQFKARGIRVAAVTFDPAPVLAHFAERAGIGFPLLSDPDSEVIRAFGILNQGVAKDHEFYGIPIPGEYLVGSDRRVRSKTFEDDYSDRVTAGRTLVQVFGAEAGGGRVTKISNPRLTASVWASDDRVYGGNRVALVVDIELGPKMHVYAPEVEGYIPIAWTMEDVEGVSVFDAAYPQSHNLHLPAIGEIVPVYEGRFRLTRDVLLGQPDELKHLLDSDGALLLRGKLRVQACDDKVCYLPEQLDVEWRLELEAHDRTRVPESLRKR